MEPKPTRPGRKDYLNQFKMDDTGQYAYRGTFMAYAAGAESWKKDLLFIWLSCVIPLILLAIMGFLPKSGLDGNLIVLLPYGLSLIALFALIWKVCRLTYGGQKIRKYVYDSTVKTLPGYAAAVMILAAFALVGGIITQILGTFHGTVLSAVLLFAGEICAGLGGFFVQKIIRGMDWKET